VFVRNYGGGEQVHMGPRTEGMRRMDNAPEIKTKIDRYRGYSENLIKIHDGMTDSDLQAISFENRRRTRVHRIVDTLVRHFLVLCVTLKATSSERCCIK
jgi:hypothetical protein